MENPLDVELKDHVLDDEIRLVTELMVVATMAPGELEQEVIDETLGVEPRRIFPEQRDADWRHRPWRSRDPASPDRVRRPARPRACPRVPPRLGC